MKTTGRTAIGLLVLLSAHLLCAQTPAEGWQDRLDKLIEQGVQDQHVPGLAVGIVQDGQLVYARGFGRLAMSRPGKPITPRALFHMASVTKPFVATAIMQLVEQGKVDLDAPVVKYLPYFRLDDPRYRSITVRQMLTHTSGMPDVEDYEWNKPQYDDGALERYVRSLTSQKLLWEPGTRYAYSNMAFDVLGDLIAKVSGMSFEDYVAAHILKPLKMDSSTLLRRQADPALVVAGYTRPKTGGGDLVPIPAYPDNRIHGPSGNLLSSVVDMSRWARANLNRGELDGERILKSSSYDILWKPAAEVEFCRPPARTECRKPGSSVGLSWFLEQRSGHLIVSHGGGDDGFITALWLVPDRNFAFILMTNSDSAGIPLLKQISAQAAELALPQAGKDGD